MRTPLLAFSALLVTLGALLWHTRYQVQVMPAGSQLTLPIVVRLDRWTGHVQATRWAPPNDWTYAQKIIH